MVCVLVLSYIYIYIEEEEIWNIFTNSYGILAATEHLWSGA